MKIAASIAVLWLAYSAVAQTPSAKVVGRVTDATGAIVPNVPVKITSVETNVSQQASSNEVGEFTIPYLNPGRYTLEAKAPGFRTYQRAAFALAVDQVLRLDVPLEVGAAAESVTVTETPSALNTETGTRGEVTSAREIAELPLDGRNFTDLATLTGGVIPKGDGGDGTYAINGARADNVAFLLDGTNNTQRRNSGAVINPPLEGVQEFKMITSGFQAEYGRYAGGVLSVVTKSGTNRFRGALYEFLRNDMWDAFGYFDVEKARLRRNQFGATVGGPVIIPKLYDGRNKTFFLVTWESLRLTDGKTQLGIVPTPEMLRGDFSKAVDANGRPITLNDPIARAPFAGNQIPANRFDPVSTKLAAYFPKPNLTGSANNYIGAGNQTTSNNNIGIKGDHHFGAKDRLALSAFWRPNTSYDPLVSGRSPIPLFGLVNNTLDVLSYARYLRIVTPAVFVELTASFSRKTNNQRWPLSAERDWAGEVGFNGAIGDPFARGLPQLEASGYIFLGPAYDVPKVWAFNNYQYSGTTTWILNRHNLKFGADFLRMQYFNRQYGDTRGRVTFLGRFTTEPMADLLLGWPQSTRRQLDATGPYHLVSNYSAFVQDDFKISRNLTLNLGLRYDVMKPPREKFGAWSMFVPALGKIVIAGRGTIPDFDQRIQATGLSQFITMAADAGFPPTIRKTDYTDFAPRFGFAWRPFNSTVLRGGYGLFYGSSSIYRTDEYSDTYPFTINESYSAVSNNPLAVTMSNPYPLARRSVGGVTSTNGGEADYQSQYIQSWNLTVEREIGREFVLEVAYAGSKGTHLPRRYDLNQQGRTLETRTIRPFQQFSTINIINDGSNSIYNSGALTVRRRFSERIFVRAAYTYSKALDESSNTGGTIQYNFPIAQDSRNLKGERGRADFDVGHAFTGSFVLEPKIATHVALRNWMINGSGVLYTGQPFTPKVANFSYTNGEASRPDRVAKGDVEEPSVNRWFDRSAFPVVPLASYRFGTSGRNILDGPGTFNMNASISRRFQLAESVKMQFRFESFNTLNHPNFNLPENRVDIISGGTISRAKNNRVLQAGLRLEF